MELLNDRFRKANLQVGTLNNQQCHKLYLDVIQLLVAREKILFPNWLSSISWRLVGEASDTESDVPKTS